MTVRNRFRDAWRAPARRGALHGVLASLFLLVAARAQDAPPLQPLPDSLAQHGGVIGIRLQGEGDELHITHVRVGSPAEGAGLETGDRLWGADSFRLTSTQEVLRYVQSLPPDSSLVLHLRRHGQPLSLACEVTDRRRLFGLMIEQRRPPPAPQERHGRWLDSPDPITTAFQRLSESLDAGPALQQLRRALVEEGDAYGQDCRLADVDFALQHPLYAHRPIRALAAALNGNVAISRRVEAMLRRLDLAPAATPATADTLFSTWRGEDLYDEILRDLFLAGTHALAARPPGGLPPALRRDVEELVRRFDASFYLDEGDRDETLRHTATLRWAKQVDLAHLGAAMLRLAGLAAPDRLQRIGRAARALPHQGDIRLPGAFAGDIRFAQLTSWGWLVVGGRGANVYGEDAALIIDLGGDDLYLGGGRPHAGEPASPVGVIIDLDGDDRYIDRRSGSIGGAIAGVAALIDAAGDDLYEGSTLTQASTFAGAGLLVDRHGEDLYLGERLAQGAALFGLALLADDGGHDLYSAVQFAQGFAGPRAVAALADAGGNDRYQAGRGRASGYGVAGVYKAWAQGAACGLRGFAAGGIALLLDEEGDDEYRGGNFSQGIGYFFGLGGLVDRRGNDRYWATRYSQGSAAHQAAGVLLDDGGDDEYTGRIAANQGAAWDAAVALLGDAGGDDTYTGAGLSQGAAAMNGVGLLFDGKGDDRYRSSSGQGDGGSTQYWGGREAQNLGMLFDGGGRDSYDRPDRRDGATLRGSRVGLFHDAD